MDINSALGFFVVVWLKFFFLLTPFFSLSMFLSLTKDYKQAERKKMSLKTTAAIIATCLFLLFFGNMLFDIFGITVDAFRIGAGAILFLSAVSLVRDNDSQEDEHREGDISVVPMAIPFTVGPGTTGALLVMGADIHGVSERVSGAAALVAAGLSLGIMLYCSSWFQNLLKKNGLNILSKLTGLILSALAAQLIFTGIKNFLNGSNS